MAYFIENDGGRSLSKRKKQSKDCTVRAMAISFGIDYDIAYDFLKLQGRKSSRGFHLEKFLTKCAKENISIFSHKIIKHSFPAQKGLPRMNVGNFCQQFKNGKFIVREAGHVACVKNGQLHDLFYDPTRCVYTAFEIILNM